MALEERLEEPAEVALEEARFCLEQVGKEASLVERLAAEVKAERLGPAELPALLENLAARLGQLSNPKGRWQGLRQVLGGQR
jgi:hypothetical protein